MKVLKRDLKQAALLAIWTTAGSLFHTVGAAILKARAPHIVCDLGTCKGIVKVQLSVSVVVC